MKWAIPILVSILILGGFGFTQQSFAATVFFGPTPYLSTADIPVGFYGGGSPTALEDFEDGTLDFGIIATSPSGAGISVGGPGPFNDSVDADDGVIDGDNTGGVGHAHFIGAAGPAPHSILYTFPFPVPEAGLVWTDSTFGGTQTFEAFGPGMVSLGTIGPFSLPDVPETGETAEDRFFGVTDPAGIIAIKMTDSSPSFAFEIDHVQFGINPPVGGTLIPIDTTALLVAGAQTTTPWLILGVVVVVGIGLAVFTLKRSR